LREQNQRLSRSDAPLHGAPRKPTEVCKPDEHPGWVEDAMGVVVCSVCAAIANHHLGERSLDATPDGDLICGHVTSGKRCLMTPDHVEKGLPHMVI
jgi:hypothetical protein